MNAVVRGRLRSVFLRRALLAALALALLTPPTTADAVTDPLQAAVDRVTRATQAQHEAVARYLDAEGEYHELEDDAQRTQNAVDALVAEQKRLGALARQRALLAYKHGSLLFDDIFTDGSDVLEAARRTTILDRVNAKGNDAIGRLRAVTDDLHARKKELAERMDAAKSKLAEFRNREAAAKRALNEAAQAERDLRARLEREKRVREYAAIVTAARQRARAAAEAAMRRSNPAPTDARGGNPSAGNRSGSSEAPGRVIGSGNWICPVQGSVSFRNDWGEPRSGGRTHKGTDMFAARGTPVVAPVAGSVWYQTEGTGGLSAYVNGNDGNTYYETHLNDYVGGDRPVKAGEVVGHVGSSGNADGGAPHLHFEIRVGGANGTKINPYPTLAHNC